jgi:hypothetical protein
MRAPLVALIGLALALPAQAAAQDWNALPYFRLDQHDVYIATDTTWKAAKEVQGSTPFYVTGEWSQRGLTRPFVWAAKCGAKAQTATFSKVFDLVGPAATMTGNLQFATGSGFFLHTIKSVQVLVNGFNVARLKQPSAADFTLGPAALARFHYGPNLIQVRAVRKKLPKHQKCNHGARSQINGISLALNGTFRSDLSYRKPPRTEYFKTVAGKAWKFTVKVGTINHGPSHAVEGATMFTVGLGPNMSFPDIPTEVTATPSGLPYSACTITKASPKTYTIFCPFSNWEPSETAPEIVVEFIFRVAEPLPQNFTQTAAKLDWDVAPGPITNGQLGWSVADPNLHSSLSDNHSSGTFVLCGEHADDPGCATAAPSAPPAEED